MKFVTKAFVLHYQRRLVDMFGGSHGLRSDALLESALAQPEATFDGCYLHEDLCAMAAAYAFHLCRNHPFVDGNKRIAAVVMGTFLAINGEELVVDEADLYLTMMAVAEGRLGKAELAEWLRSRLAKGTVGPSGRKGG